MELTELAHIPGSLQTRRTDNEILALSGNVCAFSGCNAYLAILHGSDMSRSSFASWSPSTSVTLAHGRDTSRLVGGMRSFG